MADFRSQVVQLHHGTKRTRGTGAIVRNFSDWLSRRRVQSFVARLRQNLLRWQREVKLHVTWHLPNLAWAIDALQLRTSPADPGVVVVLARDLASNFHFEPLVLKAESALRLSPRGNCDPRPPGGILPGAWCLRQGRQFHRLYRIPARRSSHSAS